MLRRFCLLSALLALSAWTPGDRVGAQSRSARSAPTSSIDVVLKQAVVRGDVPGVVAIATNKREVFYSGAYGMAEAAAGRPMKADAIFRIASMTKAITSVAAMQLVEQRKLSLDDPVSKYIQAFERLSVVTTFDASSGAYSVRPARNPITVRQLLTHTSGLGYGFTHPTVRDFKTKGGDRFDVGPLMFDPGAEWLYGTSTDWVGRLVETISGQTLDTYIREHITDPLGMHDTSFNIAPSEQPRLVNLWQRDGSGALSEQPRQPPGLVTQFNGGGGLHSTAHDYSTFVRMILNDGRIGETNAVAAPRILAAASVVDMSRNHIGSVGVRALRTAQPTRSRDFTFIQDGRDKWGLGFLITRDQVPGLRSPGSLSWGGINNTYFWIDRSRGIGGVIMMQLLPFADPKALAVYEAFERAVYASL